MQNDSTEFCGYSVPHPYEPKLNLRLQTVTKTANTVLLEGLKDMITACDILEDSFETALNDFNQK